MKNSLVKVCALIAFATLNAISFQSEARIFGLLSESKDENIKIESVGSYADAKIKVSFDGYATPLEATSNTGFQSLKGNVKFQDLTGPGYEDAIVFALTQEPQFGEFFNAFHYPEGEREARQAEHKAKKIDLYKSRTQVLDLKKDILAALFKPEYVDHIHESIVRGQYALILAVQHHTEGESDYRIKYIHLDPATFFMNGTLYQSGASK